MTSLSRRLSCQNGTSFWFADSQALNVYADDRPCRDLMMAYYCENCGHKVGSANSANVHRRFGHTVVTLMLEAADLVDEFDEDELEEVA